MCIRFEVKHSQQSEKTSPCVNGTTVWKLSLLVLKKEQSQRVKIAKYAICTMTILTKLIPDIPTFFPHSSLLCSELLIVKEKVLERLEITVYVKVHHLEHSSTHIGNVSSCNSPKLWVVETEHSHKMLMSVKLPDSVLNHESQIQP